MLDFQASSYERKGCVMTLRTENLSFRYADKPVLESVSIEFRQGLFYGILGPNGCGKTTMLDLLIHHLTPREGSVYYKDKPIEFYSSKQLACEIALVAQNDSVNFPYSVSEVVMMGRHPYINRFSRPSGDDWECVRDVMAIADIDHLAGKRVTELSGGERQRVVFARGLAQNTPVLLLDEATSNLDIHHSLNLLGSVRRDMENNNRMVISVFHDVNLAALFCDRLILMKDSSVFMEGTVVECLHEEALREVFQVDSSIRYDDFSGSPQVVFRKSDQEVPA